MPYQHQSADSQAKIEGVTFIEQRKLGYYQLAAQEPYEILQEARDYLNLFHQEGNSRETLSGRLREVQSEIADTGTYHQTFDELVYGARVAWRNNTRCIGRLYWKTLHLRDMRHLSTAEEIFEAMVEHIRLATNGGKIRSTITVFAPQSPGQPGIRIWNPQLIRYAGYRQEDRSIIGDPLNVELTEMARLLGWEGGEGSNFDLLPVIIQMPRQHPKLFELPRDAILEVPISHPDYTWFAQLGLKWHALPVISNMRLDVGGISYTAAPFNGWYMGTEIGARNLGDSSRYNLLPLIAQNMRLDTRSDRTMWKDRAMIELNAAVLYSFAQHGITVVDHHTASRQFLLHEQQEKRAGREVPAHWVWMVPPISGSASPLFHVPHYKNTILKPNFFYQRSPWREYQKGAGCPI